MQKKRQRTSATHRSPSHIENSCWRRVLRQRRMRRNSHLFAPENTGSIINTELYGIRRKHRGRVCCVEFLLSARDTPIHAEQRNSRDCTQLPSNRTEQQTRAETSTQRQSAEHAQEIAQEHAEDGREHTDTHSSEYLRVNGRSH